MTIQLCHGNIFDFSYILSNLVQIQDKNIVKIKRKRKTT
ncbi:hypothetical protein BACI9J_60601 [Bacillus altitudinis]|nr:hypothetical protein BACI9J_60601 [Bacillus altitudinis]